MNGILFNLFRLFIVNTYDYVGWTKIQEIAMNKKHGEEGTEKDFFYLLTIAKDILDEEQLSMLKKFGQFCFLHLLENSLLKDVQKEKNSDMFLYSDSLINLKIQRLNQSHQLGWEIDGQIKFSNENVSSKEKSVFRHFIDGFISEGDKYYGKNLSLDLLQSAPEKYDSCKIKVLVDN